MVRISRERDAEVAREAILEAAEAVFAREGFDGARIDTIAAESGYNKSLIFHYFDDKEGLYRAIIRRLKERLVSEFMQPLTAFIQSSDEINAARVRAFLDLAVGQYLRFLTEHPLKLRMMAWEAAEGWHIFMGEPSKETLDHKDSMNCTADFLRRARQAGVISQETDIRFLVITVGNMCMMHLLSLPRYQWFFDEPLADQQLTLHYAHRQIVQLISHGILTSSEEGTG